MKTDLLTYLGFFSSFFGILYAVFRMTDDMKYKSPEAYRIVLVLFFALLLCSGIFFVRMFVDFS